MCNRLISLCLGSPILLDKQHLLVGRSTSCDVVLFSNRVSKHHCQLFPTGLNNEWFVLDQGSANGTFVNGTCIGQNLAVLRLDDEIWFSRGCKYRLVFK